MSDQLKFSLGTIICTIILFANYNSWSAALCFVSAIFAFIAVLFLEKHKRSELDKLQSQYDELKSRVESIQITRALR